MKAIILTSAPKDVAGVHDVQKGAREEELRGMSSYPGFHCVTERVVSKGMQFRDGTAGVYECTAIAGVGVNVEEVGREREASPADADASELDVVEERASGVDDERSEDRVWGDMKTGGAEREGRKVRRVHAGKAVGEGSGETFSNTSYLGGEGEDAAAQTQDAGHVLEVRALASVAAAKHYVRQRDGVGDERAGSGGLVLIENGVGAGGAVRRRRDAVA
ncbi:hypothetical protein GOP47_0024416 [Adiantum capillus-veneris]|uniref:Uncharacterized protein n=1 Tax=Adiantum capillus-veneris TaxID=13818 RepID=A0A9D4Z509_ADICA|nr:hypothetical protein GOP47_0024416 [Adiantum capillus-veneris]